MAQCDEVFPLTFFSKPHPDGKRLIEVVPLTFGRARIVLSNPPFYDDGW